MSSLPHCAPEDPTALSRPAAGATRAPFLARPRPQRADRLRQKVWAARATLRLRIRRLTGHR